MNLMRFCVLSPDRIVSSYYAKKSNYVFDSRYLADK